MVAKDIGGIGVREAADGSREERLCVCVSVWERVGACGSVGGWVREGE